MYKSLFKQSKTGSVHYRDETVKGIDGSNICCFQSHAGYTNTYCGEDDFFNIRVDGTSSNHCVM